MVKGLKVVGFIGNFWRFLFLHRMYQFQRTTVFLQMKFPLDDAMQKIDAEVVLEED